eukprot:15051083-Alexandrium_andersonii.AAC.1
MKGPRMFSTRFAVCSAPACSAPACCVLSTCVAEQRALRAARQEAACRQRTENTPKHPRGAGCAPGSARYARAL